MAKIRGVTLSDIPKLNKLISFMDVPVKSLIDGVVLPFPLNYIYRILPMRLKFIPESYVLTDNGEISAFISVKKMHGNHRKWRISKLFLAENANEAGLLLIQYIVSKFGAKGAHTFVSTIDETQAELIRLFVEGAGFRHCGRRQIWRGTDLNCTSSDFHGLIVRPFKNVDAANLTAVFNEALMTHFRPSVSRSRQEFIDNNIFSGLSASSEFRYVVEDRSRKQILAHFTIKTADNKNYLLDPVVSKGFEHLFEPIISYAVRQAKRRTKDINFFVLNRYYLQNANEFETLLKEKNYQPSNSYIVLVKDLFRTAKDENYAKNAIFYTEIGSNLAFRS